MKREEILRCLEGYDVRDTQPVEVPPSILAEAAAMLAADARLIGAAREALREVAECSTSDWLVEQAENALAALGAGEGG